MPPIGRDRMVTVMVAAIVMAVIAACSGSGSVPSPSDGTTSPTAPASPSPDGSDPVTPSPTPSPSATLEPEAVAAAVVDLAVGAWNTVMQAPEGIEEAPPEVRGAVEGATAPGGTARAFFEQRYSYYDEAIAPRGDVMGEALEPATIADDGTVAVPACVSVAAHNTGDQEVRFGLTDSYLRHELVAQPSRHGWVLTDIRQVNDENDIPVACAPPTLAAQIESDWQAYIEADNRFLANPDSEEAAQALSRWLPAPAQAGSRDVRIIRHGLDTGFEILELDRASVLVGWCSDTSRNPEARVIMADGTEVALVGEAVTATFSRSEGELIYEDSRRTSRETVAEAPGTLQEVAERCFDT